MASDDPYQMSKAHQRALQTNSIKLQESLDSSQLFVSHLLADGVLLEHQYDRLEAIPVKRDQAKFLFKTLKHNGPKVMESMIKALMETDQEDLAELLDKTLVENWRRLNPDVPAAPNVTPPPNPSTPQAPTKHLDVPDDPKGNVTDKMKDQKISIEIQSIDTSEAKLLSEDKGNYKMTSSPRGRAVIIEISTFTGLPEGKEKPLSFRDGSEHDVSNAETLFTELGFEVDIWPKLTKEELLEKFKTEQENPAHEQYDSFVIIIMSHGKKGGFFTYDSHFMTMEEVTAYFDEVNCPALKDKPKMIFVQACQGSQLSRGVVVAYDDGDAVTEKLEHMTIEDKVENREVEENGTEQEDMNQTINGRSNFYVAYSTVPDYLSVRMMSLGTWFIREIATVFSSYAYKDDLAELMRRVRNNIINKKAPVKQVTLSADSCSKRIYFLPGYKST